MPNMRLDHTVICQFKFICNERWENLATIPNEPNRRFCSVCNTQVHLTDSYRELEKNITAKRCVAIFLENPGAKPSEYMGSFDPYMLTRSVDELDLLSSTSELLTINGLQVIGDLITRTEIQLVGEFGITENQLSEILEMLASRGLTLGMKIED